MFGKKYLISIIIPVFNSELYIENTFNSIKKQSIGFNNLEIIFVDDCSTDNTAFIIQNLAEKYANVKCIFSNKNSGFAGQPRNIGIQNASADYLMFIDSDDIFYPNACKFLYDEIHSSDLDIVSGNYVVNTNGIKETNIWPIDYLNEEEYYSEGVFENDVFLFIPPAIMSKIYKKSIILENNIKFPIGVPGEDLVFSSKYLLHAKGILFKNVQIFEYIIRDSGDNKSVSYDRNKSYLKGLIDSYKELYFLFNEYGDKFLINCFSRLNYWVFQFIYSDLSIFDRIYMLDYAYFLFIESKKIEGLNINQDYELIFKNIFDGNLLEASLAAESIKNGDDFLKTKNNFNIQNEIKYFVKELDSVHSQINMLEILFNKYSAEDLSKGIKLIEKWNLFDYDFYKSEYNYNLKIDPLLHYLAEGYLKGYNPSAIFDGEYYISTNKKILSSDMNPLLYFVLYGVDEGNVLINKEIYPYHEKINKTLLIDKIKDFNHSGVTAHKRNQQLIISLTSFPERLYDIHFCLYSLLNQKFKPDRVILWLAEEQFPNKESDIPDEVIKLKNNGLEIKWCEDLGAYKKLIPSLKLYPNDLIVTADDDLFYSEDWLKQLYEEHIKYPNEIISQRSRKISLIGDNSFTCYDDWKFILDDESPSHFNFSTNGAGSLFPPNCLYKDIVNENLFKELSPHADDVWIWAMAVLNRTKVRVVPNNKPSLVYVNLARELNILDERTLYFSNVSGGNDSQIENVINHYPKILEILMEK